MKQRSLQNLRPAAHWLAAAWVLMVALVSPTLARGPVPIDRDRTQIRFSIDAIGWPTTRGTFRSFSGRIAVDIDNPSRSDVRFEVASGSIDTGSATLDDYIKGAAFLNAARFPTISFVSTDVSKLDDRTARIEGDMTLLGVTRPVALTVVVQRMAGARVGLAASGIIRRSQFGMVSGQPLILDDINLTVTTETIAP
ncbi:MAG: YceI family protein [Alsobacter sp.]